MAAEVRRQGAPATDLPWDNIEEAERKTAAINRVQAALHGDRNAEVARAWSAARAGWNDLLDDTSDQRGREAFARWGRHLRGVELENGAVDGQ